MLPKNVSLKFFSAAVFYFLIDILLILLLIFNAAPSSVPLFAVVHIFTLGWVTLAIFGAMEQMIPVLSGTKLYNPKIANFELADLHFYALNFFLIAFFLSASFAHKLVKFFAVAVFIMYLLFAFIIFKTIKKYNLVLKFFAVSIIYLLLASMLGILILFGYFSSAIAHVHAAFAGWVTLTIFGAMYHMLPMLALKKLHSERLAEYHLYLSNIAVLGFVLSLILFNFSKITSIFGILLLLSFYLFAYILLRTLFQGEFDFSKLDISAKYFVFSLVYLIAAGTAGAIMLVFNIPFKQLHYHIALLGWVTLTIFGGMYHIVPMLIWIEKYSSKIGKEKIPTVKEMYDEKHANTVFLLSNASVLGLLFGMVLGSFSLQIGASLLFAAASLAFSYRMLGLIKAAP